MSAERDVSWSRPSRRTFLLMGAAPLLASCIPQELAPSAPETRVAWLEGSGGWDFESEEVGVLLREGRVPSFGWVPARQVEAEPFDAEVIRLGFRALASEGAGAHIAALEVDVLTPGDVPFQAFWFDAGALDPTAPPLTLHAHLARGLRLDVRVRTADGAESTTRVELGGLTGAPLRRGVYVIAAQEADDVVAVAVIVDPASADDPGRLLG